MSELPPERYGYGNLPTQTSFRVAELLPGDGTDPVRCLLHTVDWADVFQYEALSYAWGNPDATVPLNCYEKVLHVTENLYSALTHLRFSDRSRYLWADALW